MEYIFVIYAYFSASFSLNSWSEFGLLMHLKLSVLPPWRVVAILKSSCWRSKTVVELMIIDYGWAIYYIEITFWMQRFYHGAASDTEREKTHLE